MRVAALGGCGGMGRYAVRTAAQYDFVDEVLVADQDLQRATEFAATVGSKARAIALDAADEASLDSVIAGCDVVLNTVGPFYRFGVPILRAAIRNGANYLDINDDWEPTLEMLELSQEAVAAGVTAVVGLGASPGVSNLLAMKAMDGLDKVDTIITGWSFGYDHRLDGLGTGESGSRGASAATVHWLHQCSGLIRVVRDGRATDVKPLEEREIDYPGVGVGRAWSVGHPEAVTLPRIFSVNESVNVMVGSPQVIAVLSDLAEKIDQGELNADEAAARLVAGDVITEATLDVGTGAHLPPMFAHATGTRDGREVRQAALVLAMPPKGMGGSTGVPLACGLAELAAGRLTRNGVFSPEEVIDPDAYLAELGTKCEPARGASEMVLVSSSDDAQ